MGYDATGGDAVATRNWNGALFGERLRSARLAAGFTTARQFAHALGLAENRYTRYERGETEPALGTLTRICQNLAITPDDLMGFTGPRQVDQFGPGFADAIPRGGPVNSHPSWPTNENDTTIAGRARRLGWRVAVECAANEVAELPLSGTTIARSATSLSRLRRTCELFRQLEHDPFGFIATTIEDQAVDNLPPERQRALAEAIDAFGQALALERH